MAGFKSGGGITKVTSADGSIVVTHATGPTTDLSAAADQGINQLTGDVTAGPGTGSQAATLATVATAQATGDASHTPTITIDAKGRVTTLVNNLISITVSQISNFTATLAGYLQLAGGTMTGTLNMGAQTLTNLTTPVNPSDACTKAYADAAIQGLSIKDSCQEATAAALPTSTYAAGVLTMTAVGVLSVDGVAVASGDRVLVKNQVAALQNGIYTVTTLGTVSVAAVLTRATDSNTSAEIVGAFTFIENGTVNASAGFVNTNMGTITVGTTAITYSQFSGAGEINAGTGLLKSGNTLSADTTVIAELTATQTLTNKRITKRVSTTSAPGGTPSMDTDNYDYFGFTGLATAITSMTTNLTGTPTNGDLLWVSFTDNGTAQSITWGVSFESSTVTLPTTTVASARLDVILAWNIVTSKWRCLGVS
jgi:hypothetical protein